jgi:archaellum component FlaC
LAQKKINEIDDEIEFPDDNQTDDTDGEDDTIEQLIKEKKRLKKMYEYLRVRYGRK